MRIWFLFGLCLAVWETRGGQETVCEFECSVNGAVEQLFEKAGSVAASKT
jgi:hypothetical protein